MQLVGERSFVVFFSAVSRVVSSLSLYYALPHSSLLRLRRNFFVPTSSLCFAPSPPYIVCFFAELEPKNPTRLLKVSLAPFYVNETHPFVFPIFFIAFTITRRSSRMYCMRSMLGCSYVRMTLFCIRHTR